MDFIISLSKSTNYFNQECSYILVVTNYLSKIVKYISIKNITIEDTTLAFYFFI